MDKLEKYISDFREEFDEVEPPIGHFSRFEEKLSGQPGVRKRFMNRPMIMKIAAGLLILLTFTMFLADYSRIRSAGRSALGSGDGLSSEVREAVDYYDNSATSRMASIHKLACCGQDVKKIYDGAQDEINALDASTNELKSSLEHNPNDERIQAALIQNQQMKEKVLDNLIDQLKQAKK
jgi:hypothetical protein